MSNQFSDFLVLAKARQQAQREGNCIHFRFGKVGCKHLEE